MQVTLIDYTANPESFIGKAAAICYDAKTDEESNKRRARHCVHSGHLATLRFANATFNISGISRVCSHQLVRVAHAGILQRSQRYVEESDCKFVKPEAFHDLPQHLKDAWENIHDHANTLYKYLLNHMKKQDARYVLPQSVETELNITMNFQGWLDFLENRTDKSAQQEIRDLANEIKRQLSIIAPMVFGG